MHSGVVKLGAGPSEADAVRSRRSSEALAVDSDLGAAHKRDVVAFLVVVRSDVFSLALVPDAIKFYCTKLVLSIN